MRRSLILDACVRVEFHTLIVLSVFLLFAGHNAPGGGFVGGLVASTALALRFLAGGAEDVRAAVRVHPFVLLGVGLLLATATALGPLFVGGSVLESSLSTVEVPGAGKVKLTSSLVFDVGVYLVVLGLVLLLLVTLGAGAEDEEQDRAREAAP